MSPGETANKVATVSAAFWITKIAATTLGETAGDLLTMTLGLGYALASVILVGAFLVAVGVQLRARAFHAPLFWLVVLLSSTAGTTMSDFMDRTLELGYARGSAILAGLLVAVLLAWRLTQGSLSVSRIESRRAELFYWAAILCSNTLGTALGDFLADDSGLGFAGSAALIAGILAVLLGAALLTRISRVALFWAAFVLTRPFGATFGDLLTKPRSTGGLDLGTAGASVILAAILAACLLLTARRERGAATAP